MDVCVVITCYNQGHFLASAIESALQVGPPLAVRVIVVDDGSTDTTRQVARRYPQVRYVYQPNLGLSAARNTGLDQAEAPFVVFLDADDCLRPGGLQAGLDCFSRFPAAMFVWGHYELISAAAERMPIRREMFSGDDRQFVAGDIHHIDREGVTRRIQACEPIASDYYTAFLRRNCVGMHAAVLYRRCIFNQVGLFDRSFLACEDYEMYLRISRQHPVACHCGVVAQYRRHRSSMSRNTDRMLASALCALKKQLPHICQNPDRMEAYRAGVRFWYGFYSKQFLREMPQYLVAGDWKGAINSAAGPLRFLPARLRLAGRRPRTRIAGPRMRCSSFR